MSAVEVRMYRITCDICDYKEDFYQARGCIGPMPRLPGWKTTFYELPRKSRYGPSPCGAKDQCPNCIDKHLDIPEDAFNIRTKVY